MPTRTPFSGADNNTVATFTALRPIEMAVGSVRNKIVYRGLYAEENRITMLVDDETRRTENGDRVVWVLLLIEDTTYYWRRTDRPKGNGTSTVSRCKSA